MSRLKSLDPFLFRSHADLCDALPDAWKTFFVARRTSADERQLGFFAAASCAQLQLALADAIAKGDIVHEQVDGGAPLRPVLDVEASAEALRAAGLDAAAVREAVRHAFLVIFAQKYLAFDLLDDSWAGADERAAFADAIAQAYVLAEAALAEADSSGPAKLSFHLVLTEWLLPDHIELAALTSWVKGALPEEMRSFVDGGLPKSKFGLRLLGCSKGGRTKRATPESRDERGWDDLAHYLVQPKGAFSCSLLASVLPAGSRAASASAERAAVHLADADAERVVALVLAERGYLSLRLVKAGGLFEFDRAEASLCEIHNRVHERNGMFAYVAGGEVRLGCYADGDKGRYVVVGYLASAAAGRRAAASLADLYPGGGGCGKRAAAKGEALAPRANWLEDLVRGVTARPAPDELQGDLQYSEGRMRPYPTDQRTLAVKAPCKTGKSVALQDWLARLRALAAKGFAVVAVSHRKSFTDKIIADMPEFEHYGRLAGEIRLSRHPLLVVQYESLRRLVVDAKVHVLVMDEYVSIVRQVESGLPGMAPSHACLLNLARRAERVIGLDAYLDTEGVVLLNTYRMGGEPAFVIHNRSLVHSGEKVFVSEQLRPILLNLMRTIGARRRAVVACASRTRLLQLELMILAKFPDRHVLVYHGMSDDKQRSDDIAHIGQRWRDADVIMYTSTIEVGVSFEDPAPSVVFCFFNNYTGLEATASLQMIFRARAAAEFFVHLEMRRTISSLPVDADGVAKWLRDKGRAVFDYLPDGYGAADITYDEDGGVVLVPSVRLDAYVYNTVRAHRSKRFFARLFLSQLHAWGMQISRLASVSLGADEEDYPRLLFALKADVLAGDARAVASASDLDHGMAEQLAMKGAKTEAEKWALGRFSLRAFYGASDDQVNNPEWVAEWGAAARMRQYRMCCLVRRSGPDFTSAIAEIKRAAEVRGAIAISADNRKAFADLLIEDKANFEQLSLAHQVLEVLGRDDPWDTTVSEKEAWWSDISPKLPLLREIRAKVGRVYGLRPQGDGDLSDLKRVLMLANAILGYLFGVQLRHSARRGKSANRKEYYSVTIPTWHVVIPAWNDADLLAQLYS